MPVIIMTKWPVPIDGAVKAKAMTFLQKLATDDTTVGLHVEPIAKAADPRVRTGRVDQFWRAVMFRIDHGQERHYVIHGIWPHDDAIAVASRVRLAMNPVNGLPQITQLQPAPSAVPEQPERRRPPGPREQSRAEPLLPQRGRRTEDLVGRLGVPSGVAERAMAALDEDELLALAGEHEGWLGLLLLELASDRPVDAIIDGLELHQPEPTGDDDADLLTSLRRPAAGTQFAFVEDQDELRRVIEGGDFGAWRIFLHPDQRRYVGREYRGPFRLSGGAGTGKTVVLVHRARALARRDPAARIVLTTFTTNLAAALRESVTQLDPSVPLASRLGEPGVYVTGVDALVAAVIRSAGKDVAPAADAVVGSERPAVNSRTPGGRWRAVLDASDTGLPPAVANETFLADEYNLVVLPQRVRTEDAYLRVRRQGRGVALDRSRRAQVWKLIAAYRAQNDVDGTLDFGEAAAVAAAYLEGTGGHEARQLCDHVLVDEGQDLAPTHWQVLRALVPSQDDDIFIAEDSHQRIYGRRTVLSRFGVKVVGRSQRLTLNYRTTAQNLHYAMTILAGGKYVDLEEEQPQETGYRSARSGPAPTVELVDSLPAALETIARQVRTWLEAGTPPETVAVLVHDQFERDRVVNALTERGLPARAVERERPTAGCVPVLTMHRAKGTEFSRVVLADFGSAVRARLRDLDESDRSDAELRNRSLIYVAATRARDELAVVQVD